jgi:hypothetical protein
MCFNAIEVKAIEPNDTVLRYFEALQKGDITTIKDSITGEMYKKRKVLLERNENYPEFLRKVYRSAEFEITETTVKDRDAQINVDVNFPDEKRSFTLFLKRDDEGNWKIFKEISEP